MNSPDRRIASATVAAVAGLGLALALPAAASPEPPADDDKVQLCHVTNSAKNPYVLIEVDRSAFDGDGRNDHSHHVNKAGDEDFELLGGTCDEPETPPSPPPTGGDSEA